LNSSIIVHTGAVLWLPVTLLVGTVIFVFQSKLSCEDICVVHAILH